jgi:high-affinity K+ transport system ATPase subunit B
LARWLANCPWCDLHLHIDCSPNDLFDVEEIAKKENMTLDQVVAVGDGANDLLMLAKAGFGIAFHAKDKVKKEAKHRLNFGPMTTLLYFLGIPGNHLDETL